MKKDKYLICVSNEGHEESLVAMKIYKQVSNPKLEGHGVVCVIDEEGEAYGFPSGMFIEAKLSSEAVKALSKVPVAA